MEEAWFETTRLCLGREPNKKRPGKSTLRLLFFCFLCSGFGMMMGVCPLLVMRMD
jgi:hypothetical protein